MPRLGSEKKLRAQPSYTWATIRSECSVSCGGGRSLPTALLVMGTGRGAPSGHGAHSPGLHHISLVLITLDQSSSHYPHPHPSALAPIALPWSPSLCPGPHPSALAPIALPKFSSGPSGKPRASTRRGRSLSRGSAESSAAEGPLKA